MKFQLRLGVLAMLACTAGLFAGTAAKAKVVVEAFDITATNFTENYGSDTSAPYPTVNLDFTLTWDPSQTIYPGSTTGLVINSFTLPYASEYTSDPSNRVLTVATYPYPGLETVTNLPNSYGAFIIGNYWAPVFVVFAYTDSTDSYWSTSFSPASPVADIPEPAAWAMLLVGFLGSGAVLRIARRNQWRAEAALAA